MREVRIPQSEDRIPRGATLEGFDHHLPRPHHATVPHPRHLHYGQQCWTPELRNISMHTTEKTVVKN